MPMKQYYFYKFLVTDQVFYRSAHCFALVNLKPIVPGHILVVSNRVVPRFNDLTTEESEDYMATLRKVSRFIEKYYKADGFNLAIQDGACAGQSVPHLHTHIIPRRNDSNIGDAIYEHIESFNKQVRKTWLLEELKKLNYEPEKWVEDSARVVLLPEEMKLEAATLALELNKYVGIA